MTTITLTAKDLLFFKEELLKAIKAMVAPERPEPGSPQYPRIWLRSVEVREMLGISAGTLQNMRVRGKLPFVKIGGVIFYHYDDIKKMLDEHKQNPPQRL
jgi:hypothetical protein